LAIHCQHPIISPTYARRGPPIKSEKHAKRFKEKNPGYYRKGKHYWVDEKREFSGFLNYLKEFIQEKIPPSLKVKNLSGAEDTKTSSGKKALYVLLNWVVPFA
jgi:tRNA nucleotidyltransferase (CCA-adding enzyme)